MDQLLAVGVLKTALYERLQEFVDRLARREDQENRQAVGLPTTPTTEEV